MFTKIEIKKIIGTLVLMLGLFGTSQAAVSKSEHFSLDTSNFFIFDSAILWRSSGQSSDAQRIDSLFSHRTTLSNCNGIFADLLTCSRDEDATFSEMFLDIGPQFIDGGAEFFIFGSNYSIVGTVKEYFYEGTSIFVNGTAEAIINGVLFNTVYNYVSKDGAYLNDQGKVVLSKVGVLSMGLALGNVSLPPIVTPPVNVSAPATLAFMSFGLLALFRKNFLN